ncbi:hypothetical protein CRYUN_Cryun26dG0023100 [Craigia yunnanensis]
MNIKQMVQYRQIHKLIDEANMNGPYLGLVIPNLFEMNPLLQHPNYASTDFTIDVAEKRFWFGKIVEKKVILVMTGQSMINAGITTQLLLTLLKIEGVVHYGIAGNANPPSTLDLSLFLNIDHTLLLGVGR